MGKERRNLEKIASCRQSLQAAAWQNRKTLISQNLMAMTSVMLLKHFKAQWIHYNVNWMRVLWCSSIESIKPSHCLMLDRPEKRLRVSPECVYTIVS